MSIHKAQKPKRPSADRRWTLLFIGDHGNVVTLKHFKAIVIGIGILFFFAVVFAAVLFFQNTGTLKQNKDLQKRFDDSEKQIGKLRHEKEILMARLVRAEVKTEKNVVGDRRIPQQRKDTQPATPLPQVASKPKSIKVVEKKPSVPKVARPEPVISVAVENFKVSRESENKNLNAQFKIKKTSSEPERASGRVVVVLKGDDLQTDQWLVMPAVGLAGDKPSGKRGKSFSIRRFLTMDLTSKAPNYSDQFQTAAVYVFSKTGELLLEQDFAVKLPPAPVRSADTPSAQTATEETPSTPTASEETPSSPTPSGEVPESGDTPNSLDSIPSIF